MTTPIKVRRRTSGAAGAPSSLLSGELAVNFVDSTFYIGTGDDGNGNATSILPFGGNGAFVSLPDAQSITGIKTFTASPIIPNATGPTQPVAKGQMDTALALKANLASPTLTGTPTAPTPASSDSSTQLATTAFVKAQGYLTGGSITDLGAPTSNMSMAGYAITNLAAPVNDTDAVNKVYADNLRQGLNVKAAVRVIALNDIVLSGTQTIDGITLVTGNRVLVAGQTLAKNNGIYVASTGAWSRATDAGTSTTVTTGLFTFVEEGVDNADSGWVLTTNGPITLGSTGLNFTQFSGAGTYLAGDGLFKAGNVISASGVVNRISTSNAGIDISPNYVGQTSISTLGTVTTGTWHAQRIGLEYGGTGTDLLVLSDDTMLKKTGGAIVPAVSGTDYLAPGSVIDGGTF